MRDRLWFMALVFAVLMTSVHPFDRSTPSQFPTPAEPAVVPLVVGIVPGPAPDAAALPGVSEPVAEEPLLVATGDHGATSAVEPIVAPEPAATATTLEPGPAFVRVGNTWTRATPPAVEPAASAPRSGPAFVRVGNTWTRAELPPAEGTSADVAAAEAEFVRVGAAWIRVEQPRRTDVTASATTHEAAPAFIRVGNAWLRTAPPADGTTLAAVADAAPKMVRIDATSLRA